MVVVVGVSKSWSATVLLDGAAYCRQTEYGWLQNRLGRFVWKRDGS